MTVRVMSGVSGTRTRFGLGLGMVVGTPGSISMRLAGEKLQTAIDAEARSLAKQRVDAGEESQSR